MQKGNICWYSLEVFATRFLSQLVWFTLVQYGGTTHTHVCVENQLITRTYPAPPPAPRDD
eukprot:355635-Chlamydomonas_euryale.AAC.2